MTLIMYEVVKAIVEEEHRRKAEGKEDLIPMRSGPRVIRCWTT
ncbi:mannonate dehydratase [Escherichia coli]|uniref:Mannonate dehydratase n=1 Tax=Escherichia coli TaxID=562 RepID=A0A2X1J7C2_ECOLX|nr:mannonate dehydratase [Escherichia coli]